MKFRVPKFGKCHNVAICNKSIQIALILNMSIVIE